MPEELKGMSAQLNGYRLLKPHRMHWYVGRYIQIKHPSPLDLILSRAHRYKNRYPIRGRPVSNVYVSTTTSNGHTRCSNSELMRTGRALSLDTLKPCLLGMTLRPTLPEALPS